jgi:hypothetical protein
MSATRVPPAIARFAGVEGFLGGGGGVDVHAQPDPSLEDA